MYIVCKTFKVPIGHRLSKHSGLCHNVHGHNLRIDVQISSYKLNKDDMVIDFHDLKSVVTEILDKYDHATLFNPTDTKNIEFFKNEGYKIEFITKEDEDPTAEVFSKFLFEVLKKSFPKQVIDYVKIWENDNSCAGYSE